MEDYVPLLQTGVWVIIAGIVTFVFRKDLAAIRRAVVARLESGSSLRVGFFEIGEELAKVKDEVGALQNKVSELFLLTMSPAMYENLRKLGTGRFGAFVKSTALERELRHLRDIGYIRIDSIGQLPSEGSQLNDFVDVTQIGGAFIELREGWSSVAVRGSSNVHRQVN
ncbi:hypothetical protein [Cryobacterium sp. SO1]|uniref:hypothetical protein n=1 Tax=Cryobacterium sp. SO1 TaxID=1897061 RepID=UPI001023A9B1|nr:hypothetical protein [Cryobacterium sp. SO1]RZI35565.1 hypothetical protein BJQ95_02043 [Cryobacterium sp. SO1]